MSLWVEKKTLEESFLSYSLFFSSYFHVSYVGSHILVLSHWYKAKITLVYVVSVIAFSGPLDLNGLLQWKINWMEKVGCMCLMEFWCDFILQYLLILHTTVVLTAASLVSFPASSMIASFCQLIVTAMIIFRCGL